MLYFLHIPKTAGTSLHQFLSQHVSGRESPSQALMWDDLAGNHNLLDDGREVVSGHFAGLLPFWVHHWPRIITMIREPIARSLSHINHIQRSPNHPMYARAKRASIKRFCDDPVLRTTVDNLQSRYLASLLPARTILKPSPNPRRPGEVHSSFNVALSSLTAGTHLQDIALHMLDEIELVGITDRFTESLQLFSRHFGWPEPAADERLNVADHNQPTVHDLNHREVRLLTRLNSVDHILYRKAQEIFTDLSIQAGR